ncbi:MAG: hypothetical protein R3B70_35445 [Polyangiaceae bacterium]
MFRAQAPGHRVQTPPVAVRAISSLAFGAIGALALGAAGCGHPATVEECNILIDKSAELELRSQNVNDPAIIEERTKAVQAARGDDLRKKCVGKRITQDALACVQQATSPRAFDKCLE